MLKYVCYKMIFQMVLLLSLSTVAVVSCYAEGAYAVGTGPSGVWFGTSYNLPTKREARSAAMQSCESRGPWCVIRSMFTKRCLAVAKSLSRTQYSNTVRVTSEDAITSAMSLCSNQAGPCEIVASICDEIDEQEEDQRVLGRMQQEAEIARENQQKEETEYREKINELATRQAKAQDTLQETNIAINNKDREVSTLENIIEQRQQELIDREKEIESKVSYARTALYSTLQGILLKGPPAHFKVRAALNLFSFLWAVFVASFTEISKSKRFLLGLTVPIVSTIVFYYTGVEEDVTIVKTAVIALPYGLGALALVFTYTHSDTA